MQVLSIHAGQPQTVEWRGYVVTTSIFKQPVTQRVAVGKLNIQGDRQSDLSVHGGPDKAVYIYPSIHYPFWRTQYPDLTIAYGMLGENLTVDGLREDNTYIGDTFRIGTAEFTVTQPRLPCFKLAVRFGKPDVLQRMLHSGQTGFYVKVAREGEIGPGDSIEWLSRDEHKVSVWELVSLFRSGGKDQTIIQRALQVEALPASWRKDLSAIEAG